MEGLYDNFAHLNVGSRGLAQSNDTNQGNDNDKGHDSDQGWTSIQHHSGGHERGKDRKVKGSIYYPPNPDQTKQVLEYKKEVNEKCSPLIYIGGEEEPLETWPGMTPSKCNVDEGISHIQVYKSKSDENWENEHETKVKEVKSKIVDEFKKLQAAHVLSRTITEESMRSLAIKFQLTSGKWMIPVPWNQADEVWKKLVQGLFDGKFPDHLGVRSTKVYARKDAGENPNSKVGDRIEDNAMISILTKDWTDEKKCKEVAEIIKSLGINYRLRYKSDLYTICEIFRGNIYKLRPTIYIVYEVITEDTETNI